MNEIIDQVEFKIITDADIGELEALYIDANWLKPGDNTALLKQIMEKSFAVSAAFLDGRMIGIMRALSDGCSDAYMLDLVVFSEYRRYGIARKILDNLVNHLKSFGIDWIVCIGAPGTEAFYAKTSASSMDGFTPLRFATETTEA